MTPASRAKLILWILPAGMAAAGCSSSQRLNCEVDLADAAGGAAQVVCEADGAPSGTIAIKQMAQDALVRVEDFTAAAGGAQLEVASRPDQSTGAEARQFTERTVVLSHPGRLTYRYRVRPGAWMGDTVAGSYGKRFGLLDSRGALLSGRNLFLLPSWYRAIREIQVVFRLPHDWRLAGSLAQERDTIRASGAGQAAEDLIEAVLGAGAFEDLSGERQDGALRLFLRADIDAALREDLGRRARRGFEFLQGRLGPLGHDFTVVLIPPPADGSMVLVPSSSAGLGSEIASAGPVQTYDLLFGMARAWTAAALSGLRLSDEDLWLGEAIPTYQAVAALEDLGIRSSRDSWLMRSRSARQGLGALTDSRPPARQDDWLQSHRAKGAYLLALADAVAPARTISDSTVNQAIRELRRGGAGRGFFDTLSAISSAGVSPLREMAVSQASIPADWIARATGVAPLHLRAALPDARSGRLVRLLVTAGTKGMLEVCGCVARQYGGIARRETIRRAALDQPAPALMVDLGNAFPCDSKEPLLDAVEQRELALSLDLLGRQYYAAMGIGHFEMLRGARSFAETIGGGHLPYVNANLRSEGRPLAPASRLVTAGGVRVAFVSALEPRHYTGDHARFYEEHLGDLEIGDPIESLGTQAKLARAAADLVVAIGSFSPALVRRILEEAPGIDAILSTEGPDAALDGVFSYDTDGETRLMGFHERRFVYFNVNGGRTLDEIAIDLGPHGGIRGAGLTEHLLGEEVADAPDFRRRLSSFYDDLKGDPIISGSEEPVARVLPAGLPADYVGAARCRGCHESEWDDWSRTRHGSAFSILLSRHRNYAPRCVGCHVTGYGRAGGYRIGDPLERLRHVQCEMCHGPGGSHAAAPAKLNIRREPPAAACFECHTPAHSRMTEANFDDYYARTRHGTMQAGPGGER